MAFQAAELMFGAFKIPLCNKFPSGGQVFQGTPLEIISKIAILAFVF